MSKQPSPSNFRRFRDFIWRGPSSRLLVGIAAVVILILFGLLAAGVAGLARAFPTSGLRPVLRSRNT